MARITLDPEQEAAVERMVAEPTKAALNASQYGTGKTVVTVEVAARLGGDIQLIVVPLFTKYSWKSAIEGQVDGARVVFINSTKAGKQNLVDLAAGRAGWYIIGREYFATRNVVDTLAPVSSKIAFLAYDECARWANRKSVGFKNMKKFKPKYRMALSATPAANKFDGLFAITSWLWPEYVKLQTGTSYWRWVARWCATEEDYFSGVQVVGEKEPGAYVSQLPCYVRLEKDFGDPIEVRIEVELSAKERKTYDLFEKTLIAWLGENALIAKLPITKRIRLRQMTLGELSYDPDEDLVYFETNMKSTKYDTLLDIIKESGEPMLILTDSQKYASVVVDKLLADGYKAAEWTGVVPEDMRHEVKRQFVENDGVDFIVATVAAIGEGVDGLQHRARIMVWMSRSENNMLNEQAFRRLYRRGQERQVVSIDIVALNTYDEGTLSKLIQQTLNMNRSLKRS